MARVEAPVKEDGEITGVGGLVFTDGVAETDDEAILTFCREHGYLVDGASEPARAETDETSVGAVDSRTVATDVLLGTALRDAAIDPQPEDYLTPTGAGEVDPHGPESIAPGIHGIEEQSPIRPGKVRSGKAQEKGETDAVKATPRP